MGREGSRGCEQGRSLLMTYTRLKFGVYEAGRASGRGARGSDAGAYGRGLPWGRGSMAAWPLSTDRAALVSVPVGCAGKLEQERT